MKARRMLVLLAALLVFVGTAPTATASAGAAEITPTRAESGPAPERNRPTVAALPAGRRSAVLTPGAGRRTTSARVKVHVLGVVDAAFAPWNDASSPVNARGDRTRRAATAALCSRGPPTIS